MANDCISREAVLNTLDVMDKALDENRTVEAYKELLKECYKALPPVTPKPRWIPVSERLPEESGSYLTTTRNNAVRVNHFYAGHGHQVFGYRNNVIAWMPLPAPYKEGESE